MEFSARHVILGIAVTGAGFLLGVGYSLSAVRPPDEIVPSDSISRLALMKAVGRVDTVLDSEIPTLRQDVAELRRGMTTLLMRRPADNATAAAANLPPGSRELYHLQVTSDGKPQNFVRDASYKADRPNLARLAELESWTKDPDLRKKWLFTGEPQVVATFGAPDELHPDAGGEWWLYWKQSDSKVTHKYSLHMSAGRLVDVSYFENIEKPK